MNKCIALVMALILFISMSVLPVSAESADNATAYLISAATEVLTARSRVNMLYLHFKDAGSYVWDYPFISAYIQKIDDPWSVNLEEVEVLLNNGESAPLSRSLPDVNASKYAQVLTDYQTVKQLMPEIEKMANAEKPALPDKYAHAYSLIEESRRTLKTMTEQLIAYLEGNKEADIKQVETLNKSLCFMELNLLLTISMKTTDQ